MGHKHGTGAGTLNHQQSITKLMEPIAHASDMFEAAGCVRDRFEASRYVRERFEASGNMPLSPGLTHTPTRYSTRPAPASGQGQIKEKNRRFSPYPLPKKNK